jgi:hypothetical protein
MLLTSREDTRANHLIDVEEDDGQPANVIAQRRLRLDRRADSLLVRCSGAIATFDTGESQVAIVNHGGLRVGRIGIICVVADVGRRRSLRRLEAIEGETHVEEWGDRTRSMLHSASPR